MKKLILPIILSILLVASSAAAQHGTSPFGPVPPSDLAYNAATWNGSYLAPTQNAIRDQIETMLGALAPIGATYITQTPNATLTAEQAMSALGTGAVWNTTGTGVQSIATELTAIENLVSAADRGIMFTGVGTAGMFTLTAYARSFLDDVDEATFKATTNLEAGTDYNAYSATLASLAGLTETNGGIPYGTADNAYAWLAAGTATYILQANGAGAPSWTDTPSVASITTDPTSAPGFNFESSDAAVSGRTHGKIYGDLTNTGDGSEDFDFYFQAMEAGTLATFMRWDAQNQSLILPLENDAVTPTWAIGAVGTGFYAPTADQINVAIGAARRWQMTGTWFGNVAVARPGIRGVNSTATIPNIHSQTGDTDTGLGHAAADAPSMIAGAVEAQRWTEAARTIETDTTVFQTDGGDVQVKTVAAHGVIVDDTISFADGTGTVSTDITAGTIYYVTQVDSANLFNISTSRGGGNIAFGNAGTAFSSYENEITAEVFGEMEVAGALFLTETVTPTAIPNWGALYTKNDNILYFQDGEGVEHTVGGDTPVFKSYMVTTQGLGANPDVYAGGFYEAPAADADLTDGNLTQTLGTANKAEGAHAFLVASAVGTTDGSDLVITVTGISITDAGARNGSDSEVIVADATAMSTDEYFETTKKWLGQITYTLSSTAGGTYAATFNYGFAKYEDYGNRDFKLTDFEVCGFAGANDADFDIILYHHSSADWTYHATAFTPGGTIICQLTADYSTDDKLYSAEPFAYKRSGLATSVSGSGSEGIVVDIITTANNAVEYATIIVGAEL